MASPDQRSGQWVQASKRGARQVNADAVDAFTDPRTGVTVFALADGIGDDEQAAKAASVAVSAAIHSPPAEGPLTAVLAAQRAVRADPNASDCVLVVAMPRARAGTGYELAWVGDARAYMWTREEIRQITADHTMAQYFRNRHQATTPRMEHIVTTSVRTARPEEIGTVSTQTPSGLLLTSDGVHKTLSLKTFWSALRDSDHSAASLVDSAIAAGSTDNATALVITDSVLINVPRQDSGALSPGSGPPTERFSIDAA